MKKKPSLEDVEIIVIKHAQATEALVELGEAIVEAYIKKANKKLKETVSEIK